MLYRSAETRDLEACAQVMVKAMAASDDYGRPDPAEIFAHWQSRVCGYLDGSYSPGFALDDRTMFVAEQSGQILGFVAGHKTLRYACDAELQWAFILPDWQRRGIGSSLLAVFRRWCVRRRYRKVCVNASVNMAVRAFYAKHGATPMSDHWMVWEDIGASRGK